MVAFGGALESVHPQLTWGYKTRSEAEGKIKGGSHVWGK